MLSQRIYHLNKQDQVINGNWSVLKGLGMYHRNVKVEKVYVIFIQHKILGNLLWNHKQNNMCYNLSNWNFHSELLQMQNARVKSFNFTLQFPPASAFIYECRLGET